MIWFKSCIKSFFYPFEVVGRVSETQLQVDKNINKFYILMVKWASKGELFRY